MSISQKDDGRSKNLVGSIIEQQGFVSIRTKNKPGGSQWPPWPTWFRRPCQVNTALSNFMHLYRICCLVMFTVHIEVNDHRAPLRLAPLCIVTVQASQNKASLFITDSKLLWISMRIFTFTGNALGRVQRVHKPADLLDITFCTHWFWGFSTMCTHWFWGSEFSFIQQTAPTDPNS